MTDENALGGKDGRPLTLADIKRKAARLHKTIEEALDEAACLSEEAEPTLELARLQALLRGIWVSSYALGRQAGYIPAPTFPLDTIEVDQLEPHLRGSQ